jgi:hypothetical protein
MFVYGTVSRDGYHWTKGQVEQEMTENPRARPPAGRVSYKVTVSIVGDGPDDEFFLQFDETPKKGRGLWR